MKKIFKKNQLIITSLAIMIAIAGYLNFSGKDVSMVTEKETMEQKNEDVHFLRIDTDLDKAFKEETREEDKESMTAMTDKLTEIFRKALDNDKLEVKVEKLKNPDIASVT